MAGKYYRKSGSTKQDLSTLLASRAKAGSGTDYSAASWCTQFKGEPFNAPGTNTTNLEIDQYTVNGTKIKGVKIGYLPTDAHKFATFEIPGTYSIKRTSSGIVCNLADGSSVTLKATAFRDGVIPVQILVMVVGGGGGGGGCTYYKHDKDDYRRTISAAGGGGGVCLGRIELPLDTLFVFEIGSGGGPGTHGASGGENPGTAGGGGQDTYFGKTIGNILIAYGGHGGDAGPNSNGSGTGGSGGTFSYNSTTELKGVTGMNGGRGNYYNNHNKTGTAGLSWTPTSGTGAPSTSFCSSKSNNASTENHSGSSVNADSWFSGGCSYGYGVYFTETTEGNVVKVEPHDPGVGGGGCGGVLSSSGAPGAAYLWY